MSQPKLPQDVTAGGPWIKLTAAADTNYAIPGGILVNGNDYQWRIAPKVDGDPSAGTYSDIREFKTIPSEI